MKVMRAYGGNPSEICEAIEAALISLNLIDDLKKECGQGTSFDEGFDSRTKNYIPNIASIKYKVRKKEPKEEKYNVTIESPDYNITENYLQGLPVRLEIYSSNYTGSKMVAEEIHKKLGKIDSEATYTCPKLAAILASKDTGSDSGMMPGA